MATSPLEYSLPAVRRHLATVKLSQKINRSVSLPEYNGINNAPTKRLRSRYTIWLIENSFDRMKDMWKQCWEEGYTKNRHLISDPTQRVPGFDCPRAIWTNLNRIQTEQSNCNYLLHKWKIKNAPLWDCGSTRTCYMIYNTCVPMCYIYTSILYLYIIIIDMYNIII